VLRLRLSSECSPLITHQLLGERTKRALLGRPSIRVEQICAIAFREAHPNVLLLRGRWAMPSMSTTRKPELGEHASEN
jgi:hypothetical protein